MSTSRNTRRLIALTAALLAAAALSVPAALASSKGTPRPHVSTGGVSHNLGTSAQLKAALNPEGIPTSYYFQWGTTLQYGQQTPTVSVGAGTKKMKVGQTIARLVPGVAYHFRAVAVFGGGQLVLGRDRTFTAKIGGPRFAVPKSMDEVVGTSFLISGTLRGANAARRTVALQATPFPFTDPFATIGPPATTDPAGRFSFRVNNFVTSTSFRITTFDLRPELSPTIKVHALVRVVLHVRTSARKGLVRLYGTITPAVVGAKVFIQLNKPIKAKHPTKSEATTRFSTVFTTVAKRAKPTFSRFSVIANITHTGRYRAFARVARGPVESGSSATVVLHAGPAPPKHKHK